jgi:hypothetical protein
MYPSIKFSLIRKAINYFGRNCNENDRATLNTCLEILKFSMKGNILTFQDKYFEYGSIEKNQDKGVNIGSFEAAFTTDTVIAFLLEKCKELFKDGVYGKIYRDDGFKVFNRILSTQEIIEWRSKFQARINQIAGNNFLQFTVTIWKPDSCTTKTEIDEVSTHNH